VCSATVYAYLSCEACADGVSVVLDGVKSIRTASDQLKLMYNLGQYFFYAFSSFFMHKTSSLSVNGITTGQVLPFALTSNFEK